MLEFEVKQFEERVRKSEQVNSVMESSNDCEAAQYAVEALLTLKELFVGSPYEQSYNNVIEALDVIIDVNKPHYECVYNESYFDVEEDIENGTWGY
jgi:hypothetical protein